MVKAVVGDDCGCDRRREKLNRAFAYWEPMTPEELRFFEEDVQPALRNSRMSADTKRRLIETYNRVFHARKKNTSCWSCIANMARKLQTIHEETCLRDQQGPSHQPQ